MSDELSTPEQLTDWAVTLEEFIARKTDDGESALVTADEGTIIARASLVILVAKTGDGKTTGAVDFVVHGAGGVDYCGLKFKRPLRFLYVQNEGPREAFREKLEERWMEWSEPEGAEPVRVWDGPHWGLVKITDDDTVAKLRAAIVEYQIDFVVFDTVTRSGAVGNGTPEDTRDFVDRLTELGLGTDVGFIGLHHPLTRPDLGLGELEQIAGAWPPHADTILRLVKLPNNRARLSYPKLRHARAERPPSILAFDTTSRSFSWVADEQHDDHLTDADYEQRIFDWLTANPWATTQELEKAKGDDGKGLGRGEKVREARSRLLESGRITCATSKELGRHGRSKRWNVANTDEQAEQLRPLPWTENGSQPSQANLTPSIRPSVREDGVRDGVRDGVHEEPA